MKKTFILSSILILSFALSLFGQPSVQKQVKVIFKNSTWLPKKFTLISYAPGETGNSTFAPWLLPGFTKTIIYTVGTKVYLGTQQQVGIVMSGKRIDNDIPFLIVKESDNEKVISLK
jgi:hypothetical protein